MKRKFPLSSQNIIEKNTGILLDIEGMKCGGCVNSVEKILLENPNVSSASVNLVTRTAWIEFKKPQESIDDLLSSLTNRGFTAKQRKDQCLKETSESEINAQKNWWSQWRQLIIALSLLVLSLLGHLVEGQKLDLPILGTLPFHGALATFALFGPGLEILKRGLKSAYYFSPTMDSLVGLGVLSAYIASVIALIWPQVGWPCFFNEPVMLLGFVLLGRFLEERARFRTGKAIKELAELQPQTARIVIGDNQIKEVRVGALKPGEHIQLLAGDRLPVDGIVIKGYSAVDISSLTGESLPIEAGPGMELAAGSLNLEAILTIKIQKVGSETALARIIGLVEEAQARKAPIQGLADRVAGLFCYGVTSLAICTFLFWWLLGTNIWPEVLNASGQGLIHNHHVHSLHNDNNQTSLSLALQLSISVLVIACPCALGLATPTVITVSSGLAAKQGWLFRGGDVIEMAAKIKKIVFDKTGTLTIGRPLVVGFLGVKDPDNMLQLAGSLEQNSRHPLAHAILQETMRRGLNLSNTITTRTFPGEGIEGELENIKGTILVGTPEWLQKKGIEFNKELTNELIAATKKAQSLVAIAHMNKILGVLIINDQLRNDAIDSLERLRKQGISLNLFSGDRSSSVKDLGNKLGFKSNELGWELLPGEKLERLKNLQLNERVAMVGDGINDAPALAASDVGIAVGTGTQIAQESADLVLLGERLEALPDALILAQKTMHKVKQNLAWAFGYNMIALPIAAGLLLPKFGLLLSPPLAALLMALSSITVVLNALSLKIK